MLMPILFAVAVLAVLALAYVALSGPSPAKSVKRRLELLRFIPCACGSVRDRA